MRMREQVFSKECEKRGFTQCGESYMRVVGDGIFQHILLGFKERLHSSAPGYSQKHRYDTRILIFLKSMYAQYDDLYISIDRATGFSLTVPQLLDKQDAAFMGSAAETEQMLHEGLDILDRITTQHQIIEYLEPLANDNHEGPRFSTQLYDVYLYCEEFYKARMAIETEFAENYFANMSSSKLDPDRFLKKMHRFLDRDESYCARYMLTFPVQYGAVKERLQNNYEVNSRSLRRLGFNMGSSTM